ncbi:MAG: prophage endopeptidase tail family protein, partial [Clostridium sp.]
MLHLYDVNKNKIAAITNHIDLNIESDLSNSDKTLSFSLPINDEAYTFIKEECYIRTRDDEFIVKEINETLEYIDVKATMNVEALEGNPFEHFDTTEKTITECINLALAGTGWTIGTCNVTKRRTVRKTNCSSWDIIQEAKKVYKCDIVFDTLNKRINIYERLGEDKGAYFIEDLNIKALNIQRNSYDFYTRIIPIGKDGLTIESVNSNKKFVENHQYSSKVKTLIWKDERYTDINALKEDTILKLNELSKPYRAYSCDIDDLAR